MIRIARLPSAAKNVRKCADSSSGTGFTNEGTARSRDGEKKRVWKAMPAVVGAEVGGVAEGGAAESAGVSAALRLAVAALSEHPDSDKPKAKVSAAVTRHRR